MDYNNIVVEVIALSEKHGELFTVGEFASKAGVTQRTVRYYDKIDLLKPSAHNSGGHRLYTRHDFVRLQKILTLKFIGLSLEDIGNIIRYDLDDSDFKKSLEIQRDIMDKKVNHIRMVMEAIDETLHMLTESNTLNWDKFINIINIINMDKNWMEQYENASNLRARIKIHEEYSTNKHGWMRWFFEQLSLPWNARILEIGCGDGSLWLKNLDRIPDGLDITLTDFSQGMLKDARENLSGFTHRFKFKQADAQSIPFEDSSFDVVIANHMLYHVQDIDKALSEIHRVLKSGGYFYSSTVGEKHMWEMRDIVSGFDSDIITTRSWYLTRKFQLENGKDKVSKWFKDVKPKRYEDSLVVTESGPLVDYIFSMPGNVKSVFTYQKMQELVKYLEDEIKKSGGIFISKDTGYFRGRK